MNASLKKTLSILNIANYSLLLKGFNKHKTLINTMLQYKKRSIQLSCLIARITLKSRRPEIHFYRSSQCYITLLSQR